MEIYVLNSEFKEIGIIDVYNSLIWTTRYYECGDFELYLPAKKETLALLTIGNYLAREDDESTMLIETLEIKTDVQKGNFIIATGRDLKSIFDRRVIHPQQTLSGTVESAAYTLINRTCGSEAYESRKFPNFSTAELKGFTETIDGQVTGTELYAYMIELCQTYGYGWKITRVENALTCEIYAGQDRTEVHFSPEFDSLINSDYIVDSTKRKNIAFTAGEGEGTARIVTVSGANATGLERREMFIDARDISSNNGEITTSEYVKLLQQRGKEKLAEAITTEDFTGSADTAMYVYKKDYDIGDIVTVENEYGITAASRIIEIIENWGVNGYTITPTFEKWEVTE